MSIFSPVFLLIYSALLFRARLVSLKLSSPPVRLLTLCLVERVGYYLPIILISTSLMAVSNGLLSTLSPHTSTGKWIGYQILLGVSRSLGLQIVSPRTKLFFLRNPIVLTFIQARYCGSECPSTFTDPCSHCIGDVQSNLCRCLIPQLLRHYIHQQPFNTDSHICPFCGSSDNH